MSDTVPGFVCGVAGGLGGAVGAILTNPLEVVKTRLQSSDRANTTVKTLDGKRRDFLIKNILKITKDEGVKALYKGLPVTLIGTIPARFIYFGAYNTTKSSFGTNETHVHILSAMSASVSQILGTSPFWVVRTKQQLHRSQSRAVYSVAQCIRDIYQQNGPLGFWRGSSASLFGMTETVCFFLLYESCKKKFINHGDGADSHLTSLDGKKIFKLFTCTAICKMTASTLFYPHEVVRTRLREETSKKRYRGFFQTLGQVYKEEGIAGWYSGMRVHLLRQVPNSAIVLCVVESTIFLYKKYIL